MLVEVSPAISTRTTLEHTTGSDMSAWLMVEELQRRGGLSFGYQLDCRFVDRGFSLSAGHERLHAKPGGKVSLKVTAVRRNFTGAIRLGVEGLGPDVELAGAEMAAGKNETMLTISLPKNLKPAGLGGAGGLIGLKIVGEGLLEPPAEGAAVVPEDERQEGIVIVASATRAAAAQAALTSAGRDEFGGGGGCHGQGRVPEVDVAGDGFLPRTATIHGQPARPVPAWQRFTRNRRRPAGRARRGGGWR